MQVSLRQVADWVQGEMTGADATASGVSIDTRSLRPGELFFALKGPNFDGHAFVGDALQQAAVGVVVEHPVDVDGPQIVVGNSREALGALGRNWRRQHTPVTTGITGSNGKTTLRSMIAACAAQRGPVLATRGNLNNELGVPLMLCEIEDEHEFAVIEMGANRVGDIAYLVSLVEPDIVVLSNAGPAHLDGFGSLDGVARGKGEILSGEPRPDCAILNADDVYFDYWRGLVSDIRWLSFGLETQADVTADGIELEAAGSRFTLHLPGSSKSVRLPLPGEHNVRNACAAAAAAHAAGLEPDEIVAGLESVEPVGGRIAERPGIAGCRLFDDSYNANPASVTAAGHFLASLPGSSIFVLGDMFELGSDEARIHREVGAALKQAGVDRLLATGELSRSAVDGFGDGGEWFTSRDALTDALLPGLSAGCNVLVKGSRSMRMEQIVERLSRGEAD